MRLIKVILKIEEGSRNVYTQEHEEEYFLERRIQLYFDVIDEHIYD